MDINSDSLKRQSDGLRRIREEWDLSLRQFAQSLERVPSQASRWENFSKPQQMGSESRLRLARLIGSRFWHPHHLETFLHRVGWQLTDLEWREAERHLNRSPTLSKIPWVDADQFIGRANELRSLRRLLLSKGATVPLILLIEGFPGIGKSWLVAHLLLVDQAVQDSFPDGILWVSMAPESHLPEPEDPNRQTFRSLVEQVFHDQNIREHQYDWKASSRRMVRDALARKRTLLVLDGVDERIDLDKWMMVDPLSGRLLITTRRTDLESQQWRGRVQRLSIGAMPPPQSQELLTREIEEVNVDAADLDWILETLGGVPLALDIANRLAQHDNGLGELLIQLRQSLLPSLEVAPTVFRQDSLNRTFQVSYHRLTEKTARLFRALAISPQPFDAQAFSHVLGWDRADTGRTFRELAQNGLVIAKQSGQYATHHLLHEYARLLSRQHDMASLPTWKRRFADHYLELTKRASELWRQGEEPAALHLWRDALAHIRQGCRFAAEGGRRSSVLDYLLYTGYYPGANGTDVTTDEWRTRFESLTKPTEESVFGSLQLGNACLLLGDPDQAIPLLRKLRRTADTLGRYRDWVSTTIKLAQSLVLNRHQDEAWEIVAEQRFAGVVAKLPLGDPLQVDACAVAGRVHTLVGRYREAKFAYSKALATFDNGDTETQHWQHVKLLFELGRIHQALHNNEEAWEVFAEGKELAEAAHYRQLHGAHALHAIISLARMGCPEEAEEKLAALRVNLGQEQRIKAWTRLAQGEILWAKGDTSEARRAYEAAAQALAGTMAETGVRVLSARRQAQSGDTRQAREAWDQARESARKTGHWHKYHLAMLEYAEHLQEEGRRDKARELVEDLVAEKAPIAPSIIESAQAILDADN